MKIREVMTGDVQACASDDTANRAAQLMWEHDCGFIVVLDTYGRLDGVVTDRDLCMAAYTKGLPLARIGVADIMSRHVRACDPDDDHAAVMSRMQADQVRRLPVVDFNGRVVGVVSLNDFARIAAAGRGQPGRSITAESVARTLGEIASPRCSLPGGVSCSTFEELPRVMPARVPALTAEEC